MTSIEIGILAGAIFFTSALTTSTGVGGGSMLLALMLQFAEVDFGRTQYEKLLTARCYVGEA